jgi:hypothetical protein
MSNDSPEPPASRQPRALQLPLSVEEISMPPPAAEAGR